MMKGISQKSMVSLVIMILIFSSFYFSTPQKVEAKPMFLKLRANSPFSWALDNLYLLKDQLRVIGIDLDVNYVNPFDYLYLGYQGDISAGKLYGGQGIVDPDYTGIYNENGSFNIYFGYRTEMDWSEELGTGKNEWYMDHGRKMIPPYSEERIQHYWEWEQYLMDELLLTQPLFTQQLYESHWGNLKEYNFSDGLLQSWGKMSWDGTHSGQVNTDEVVITDDLWRGYNPIDWKDSTTEFLLSLCLDPLIWYDPDTSVHPHLAESFEYIDNKTIELTCRKEVKWAADPDGNFTNEYFDVNDIIFTLVVMKNLSIYSYNYDWIDSWEKIDDLTLRIHIDEEYLNDDHEYSPSYFSRLSTFILPEHYLNQTQTGDGITPNRTHISWEIFKQKPFGTGLFEISEFDESIGMNLTVRPESWWLNTSITNDPILEWENRFGDFTGGLTKLQIKYYNEYRKALEDFEYGKLDIIAVDEPIEDNGFSDFINQEKSSGVYHYFGYNCRQTLPLGNREPCTDDSSITKGFALRKAISYTMNRQEINNILHGGLYKLTDYPIHEILSIWCNPNIIRYNHDLEKAHYYMELAGYKANAEIVGFENYQLFTIALLCVGVIVVIRRKYKSNK
ncbi:MAG: ABC transporter substrate-binding protein [Candidatus Heimdallarchaeota archaeon]